MNRYRTSRNPGPDGFTFVEILAALLFLGITIPAIVSALTVANRAAVVAERTTVAADLAENRLNELVIEQSWSGGGNRGDFGTDYPGYRWEVAQNGWQYGDMIELSCEVFFQVQGQERSVRLATLVSPESTAK